MSKIASGIVLFSLLMALSLGVAFGEDVAAAENVTENAANATNVTNVTNVTNTTNVTEIVTVEAAEETAAE